MAGKMPSRKSKINKAAGDFNIAIVYSSWHHLIVDNLLNSCIETLVSNGIDINNLSFFQVPGSFEIPLTSQWLLESPKIDGVVCLGCIIKGETQHDEFIAHAINHAIMDLNLKFGKPVINGVLTTLNIKQAKARSGGKLGNKGSDCAHAMMQMLETKHKIKSENS
ncbi:MAG: 6,7-dimethyl-8-ribityllumazine synthase [Saprospiraceae bacterium]|nr:6,7-dimethyl-8-ribityllumazine synthase [Saprospiraceae bacterium]MBK7811896.1 6,7-dimethyl-8-ribityllumazine synthase [Saprospiraceae bacterium]MBK9631901.1 6,7-dimethyl-8-ribityllumazine synthase [Saprospiraceae bacterium]